MGKALVCPGCGGPMFYPADLCRKCTYPNAFAGDNKPFPLNGTEAAEYGAITSFRNSHGQTLTLHRVGPVKAAIREACDAALELDPTFRVTAVSTPTTIYQDLQGPRRTGGRPEDDWGGDPFVPEASLVPPEMRA